MAYQIKTTQEIYDLFIANIEAKLNQNTPPVDVAFNKVISGIEALILSGLYRYQADRAKDNLAISAAEAGLELIGAEYGVIRTQAVSTVLTVELPATTGVIIPATRSFVGDNNGVRYFPDTSATSIAGVATLSITAETAGVVGNLSVGDELTISAPVSGAETIATVISVDTVGAEKEDVEDYRERILFVIRASFGGSNVADHKAWAEEPEGVKRAYPYSGKPFGTIGDSYPGDRTVYVECDESIDPDGIPPAALLDEVEASLLNDPVTGESRPALGLECCNLYVEPISRVGFYVTVTKLNITPDLLADAQANIENGLDLYFKSIRPYVEGVDLLSERNDLLTNVSISEIVQDAVKKLGGTAQAVNFGTSMGSSTISYTLEPGILAKLIQVDYVV